MKSRVVKKDDYELYSFQMPLLLKKNRRRSFVAKKLEQLHPCFSDNCCYDTKFSLKKGKITASVAVMDKVKLAEYKSFQGNKRSLKLETFERYRFFGEHDFTRKIIILLCLAITSLGSLGVIKNHLRSLHKVSSPTIVDNSIESPVEKLDDFDIFRESVFELKNETKDFFDLIHIKNALLNSAEINFFNSAESDNLLDVKYHVIGCVPEDFESLKNKQNAFCKDFSAVTYNKSIPEFFATFNCSKKINVEFLSFLNTGQINAVRHVIWSCDGVLLTDNSKEGIVEFSVPKNKVDSLFFEMNEVCIKNTLFAYRISIVPDNMNCKCRIHFIQNEKLQASNILHLFENCEDLFFRKTNVALKRSLSQAPDTSPEKNLAENVDVKIGRIVQKNGDVISYYKDSYGKIRGVKE